MSTLQTIRRLADTDDVSAGALTQRAAELRSAAEQWEQSTAQLSAVTVARDALIVELQQARAEIARLTALIPPRPVDPPPAPPPDPVPVPPPAPAPEPPPPPVEPPPPPPPPVDPPPPPPPPVDPPPVEPPPVIAPGALYQLTEGGGPNPDVGLTRDWYYDFVLPWRQRGGDWLDSAGTPHGPIPFGQAPAIVGEWCEIPCGALTQQGQAAELVVRNLRGQVSRTVAGRRSQTPPVLRVTRADGSVEDLPCLASCICSVSTALNANSAPTYSVMDGNTLFLRFGAIGYAEAAVLRVFVVAGSSMAAQLGVYAMHTPIPVLAGLVAEPATLEGAADLYYRTEAFDTAEWAWLTDPRVANRYENFRWIDDDEAGRCLEIWMDPRSQEVFNGGVPMPESDEVVMEYDVKFLVAPDQPGMIDGGKMWGFRGPTKPDDALMLSRMVLPEWRALPPGTMGTTVAGNNGMKSHGNDGWSLRGGHWRPYPARHPLAGAIHLDTYAYHVDQVDLFGDGWGWDQASVEGVKLGVWHRVYQRLRMNTPGVRDGRFEARVDGRVVFRKNDFMLRDGRPWSQLAAMGVETQGGIRSCWLNNFHGGKSFPSQRFAFARFRNLKVARIVEGEPLVKSIDNW